MKIQFDLHGSVARFMRCAGGDAPTAHVRAGQRISRLLQAAFTSSGEQGSALVEFALVLPMLLLLTTGILVFGVAMNNYMQLTNAVSIGARTMAVNAGLTLDPCALGASAITTAAPNLNAASLTYNFTLNGTAYNNQSTCSSGSSTTGAAGNLASGTTVTVNATYPLNLSVFGAKFSQSHAVLSATSTELVQ
jgi:Flp pilus assembly protein TadG